MESITIRRPDDMHVHVRQNRMLAVLVGATARVFKRAVIMPNTNPPILTGLDASVYKQEILCVAPDGFEPLMTIKITPETTP